MSKFNVTSAILGAVLAAGFLASTAYAATPEWLFNGAAISSALTADKEGELTVEDMGNPSTQLLCSVLYVTSDGPGGQGTVTQMQDLTGTTTIIPCVQHKGSCSSEPLVEAKNLPWKTELVLIGTAFVELVLGSVETSPPGYLAECTVLGVKIDDLCTGVTGAELKNITGGVEETFEENNEEITPAGNCTFGGAKQGLVWGSLTDTSEGGTLSVS
jgi:hypothetical protein